MKCKMWRKIDDNEGGGLFQRRSGGGGGDGDGGQCQGYSQMQEKELYLDMGF